MLNVRRLLRRGRSWSLAPFVSYTARAQGSRPPNSRGRYTARVLATVLSLKSLRRWSKPTIVDYSVAPYDSECRNF